MLDTCYYFTFFSTWALLCFFASVQSLDVSHLLSFALAFFPLQSPLRPLLTILINSHHSLCHKSRWLCWHNNGLKVRLFLIYRFMHYSIRACRIPQFPAQIMRVDIHFLYGKRFVRRCVAQRKRIRRTKWKSSILDIHHALLFVCYTHISAIYFICHLCVAVPAISVSNEI